MTEQSSYPHGRDFCSYASFIYRARIHGDRYGYGRDKETGAMGLFIETPCLLPSGRLSKRRKFASLMRSTGRMTAATEITWKG